MRKGELRALNIKNIDFKNKLIRIDRAINDFNKITETKTGNIRVIPMLDIVLSVLEKYKDYKENNGYLFYKINEKVLYNDFKNIIKIHFNNKLTLHSLRHSFATFLFEQNIEAKVIQSILGHSNISTTLNIYTHLDTKNIFNKINKINDFF